MIAISMKAATSNITAHKVTMIHVFMSSPRQPRFIIPQVSQTLSAKAVEYDRNSSQVNGRINNDKKSR